MNFIQPWLYLFMYVAALIFFKEHMRYIKEFATSMPGDVGLYFFLFFAGVPIGLSAFLFMGGLHWVIPAAIIFWYGFLGVMGKNQDPEFVRMVEEIRAHKVEV